MARPKPEDISTAGQDSFLDVVTNIVGIIIILVMVVGGRAKQLSFSSTARSNQQVETLKREVRDLERTVVAAESEIAELANQTSTVATAAALTAEGRLELATAVAAARADLEGRKKLVDSARLKAAEAAARRQQLEADIQNTNLEADGLAHLPATTKEVLAYPTPIGRVVMGEELHFRLDGGRISYIPLTELFEQAKMQTRRQGASIASMQSRVESVGPVQGYALDYVIEAKVDQARGQVLIRSREWVVRPALQYLGETAAEAITPNSKFRRVLADATPETTVTLWCYPDSFEAFRAIREELHKRGMPVAGRPMPEGAPIGGSTEGSKSVVQ